MQYWYLSSGFLRGEGLRISLTPLSHQLCLGKLRDEPESSRLLVSFWLSFSGAGYDEEHMLSVRVPVLVPFLLLCRNPMTY